MLWRKVILAIAALPLAGLAGYDAAVGYYTAHADRAPQEWRSHPSVMLRNSDLRLLKGDAVAASERETIAGAARAVLRSTPLDAPAMRQLGLLANATGDGDVAAKLRLAEKISRRDFAAQVVLFDLATARRDFSDAADHLDNVLTVFPQASGAVYPMLASALGDKTFRTALVRKSARPWFFGFLSAAATQSDPLEVAALLRESRFVFGDTGAATLSRLLTRLAQSGEYAAARNVAILNGGATAVALDGLSFTPASIDPAFAPLAWQLSSNEVVRSQPLGGDGLGIEVQAGKYALVAQRITSFPAGAYSVEQDVRSGDTAAQATLDWNVSCSAKNEGTERIWRQQVAVSKTPARYRATLTVPPNCPVQHWQLTAIAGDAQTPVTIEIGSLTFRRR